jgi:hypothetical protein
LGWVTYGSSRFRVAGSLLSELVLPIIKYAFAPLEVGHEYSLNWERFGGWVNERLPEIFMILKFHIRKTASVF